MIEQGTKFEEYDGDVFETVLHKVVVGDDANGNFDPYQITYVFKGILVMNVLLCTGSAQGGVLWPEV